MTDKIVRKKSEPDAVLDRKPSFMPFRDLVSALEQVLYHPLVHIPVNLKQTLTDTLESAASSVAPEDSEIVEEARRRYSDGSDEIEIDDVPFLSEANDGTWVSAWVWVEGAEEDE